MSFVLKTNRSLLISKNLTFQFRCLATSWNVKFRKLRAKKVVKVVKKLIILSRKIVNLYFCFCLKPDLPKMDRIRLGYDKSETKEEERARRIKEGFEPPISFEYKPINISSSSNSFLAN